MRKKEISYICCLVWFKILKKEQSLSMSKPRKKNFLSIDKLSEEQRRLCSEELYLFSSFRSVRIIKTGEFRLPGNVAEINRYQILAGKRYHIKIDLGNKVKKKSKSIPVTGCRGP
jgi:hypothetical protein